MQSTYRFLLGPFIVDAFRHWTFGQRLQSFAQVVAGIVELTCTGGTTTTTKKDVSHIIERVYYPLHSLFRPTGTNS